MSHLSKVKNRVKGKVKQSKARSSFVSALTLIGGLIVVSVLTLALSGSIAVAQDTGCPGAGVDGNPKFDPALNQCTYTPPRDLLGGPPVCQQPYKVSGKICVAMPLDDLLTPTKPAIPDPKCALVNFGPVNCPINDPGVPPGTSDCYVNNQNAPKAADRGWKKASCTDPAFTSPGAVVCDASTPAAAQQQYCDPAVNACVAGKAGPCDLTKSYISPLIKVLSALVGIGVTISIVLGGIEYASSANDSQRVAAARRRIMNSVLVLIGYFLFYAFLGWVIPGGI
jgi:hypothetical protein